ncbi:MAG: S24 family peptidase [Clostridia bacterium]|nr:S24 family peptidase [Clostridia bacterium]
MKRLIELKYADEHYFLEENGDVIFKIKVSDLRFDSLSFYKGIYEGKSVDIEFNKSIETDPYKKGAYIYKWLSEIISTVRAELVETITDNEVSVENESDTTPKMIPLFKFDVCAGDGFYSDQDIPHTDIIDRTGNADYAVRIKGHSMEPTLMDGDLIYVKEVTALDNNDIGIFLYNGELMCKRYVKEDNTEILVPDNDDYEPIIIKLDDNCIIRGKVLNE